MDSVQRRGRDSGLPTDPVPHSADDFQRFFEAQVQAVRSSTAVYTTAAAADSASGAFSRPASSPSLTAWREVTEDEVHCIVLAAPAKSCCLDPIPTFLLRNCIESVLPFLTVLVNTSLREGHSPASQKKAVVTPLLKKPSLNTQNIQNYRPVSNLTFVSKLVERVAVKQLVEYLEANELMPRLQSAYRRHYSTETALLKVLSDALTAADNQKVTLLALLDLSAAFDCVDHDILLSRLQSVFALRGSCSGLDLVFLD